ncbi:hypothetical protein GWI33_020263 [Rhynchophorus ferrugineus]|uniref:Odorant receptor n=1 Tax=Rhynchophorus ferrugineus TaxID=354439 RepID=A0A834HRY5_RHYFE|nr:hypothetical protein GWI33_020263 [Rhynchophorus ferrugineus]
MIRDDEKLISVTKLYMAMVGMWKFEETNSRNVLLKIYNKYYSRGIFLGYILFMISLTINLILLMENGDPWNQKAGNMGILVAVIDIVVKISIFNKYDVPHFFRYVKTMERDVWNSGKDDVISLYKKQVTYCRTNCLLLGGITLLASSTFVITNFIKLSENKDAIEDFMYHIWLPVDKKQHRILVVTINMCLISYSCVMQPTIKLVLCTLMVFSSTHLQILQYKVKNRDINEDPHIFIKRFLDEHLFLIRFIERFDRATSLVMLLEFLLNAVNVAAIIVDLLTTDAIMFPVIYGIMATVQLFTLTWNANEIKEQSVALGDAFYETDWYQMDINTQKSMILIILRTQKPLMLHLGPFGAMTAETAVKVSIQ